MLVKAISRRVCCQTYPKALIYPNELYITPQPLSTVSHPLTPPSEKDGLKLEILNTPAVDFIVPFMN